MVFPGNIFNFLRLLPLEHFPANDIITRVMLPQNSLHKVSYKSIEKLYILDETHNPTYSYKDRASMLVLAKAIELGKDTICTASTGNAASSMSGLCAMAGISSKVFVPKNIPDEKLMQMKMYGADVVKIDGSYDDAYGISIEESKKHGWYNRNTAYNPLTTEGKKSGAFDIYIQLGSDIPNKIFVPTGDGGIISGIYKGFYDLLWLHLIEKIPQLIAVQSERSCGVIDYLESGTFTYTESTTIADSISVNAPRNLYMAVDSIMKSDGFAIKVSDEEILKAEKYLAQKYGYFVEPSAAAAWAGFEKYSESISKDETIVILLTGSGMKDMRNASRALEF
ncbi:MAG TPA: threonine synthase [Candidatus Cloacimonetes bacterium]|nr:threonine synthase [Candidatus Cloacimonadota bacterium]HEX38357.1 threonine synthase [Candidatus Cloacimonadota bacterium]